MKRAQLTDLRCDEIDEAAEGVGGQIRVFVVEGESRHQHGDRHQRPQPEHRAEAEGGSAARRFRFFENGRADRNYPEARIEEAER